jgi:hypothetical protein
VPADHRHIAAVKCRQAVHGRFRNCQACGRRTLKVIRETYDAVDEVVVGRQRCTACKHGHLYARRLTVKETQIAQRHLQPIRQPRR